MKNGAFLTTEEVIEYLQVNLRTVYRLIKAGKIPASRVGRQWRFRKEDIDDWLSKQATASVSALSPNTDSAGPKVAALGEPRKRVLVVDDEPSIRTLLAQTLALAEYEVDVAPDGPSALDRMRRNGYNLLITDLKMPGMDGLSVINEARRLDSQMAIVVITGFSTEDSAIKAANLGVKGYLTKPFKVPKVLEVAARALSD